MGVFIGLINFAVALWFHQTTIEFNRTLPPDETKKNAWQWFGIGAGVYFAGIVLGYGLNRLFVLFVFGEIDVGVGEGLSEASGGDTGVVAIFLELFPIFLGLLLAYIVRVKYLLNKTIPIPEFISNILSKKN